jgi:hypothetical protein
LVRLFWSGPRRPVYGVLHGRLLCPKVPVYRYIHVRRQCDDAWRAMDRRALWANRLSEASGWWQSPLYGVAGRVTSNTDGSWSSQSTKTEPGERVSVVRLASERLRCKLALLQGTRHRNWEEQKSPFRDSEARNPVADAWTPVFSTFHRALQSPEENCSGP